MAESTSVQNPNQTQSSGKGILLKADPIAQQFRMEVQASLSQRRMEGKGKPKIVGVLATSSSPSRNYAEFTRKQCEELGFEFVLKKTGAGMYNGGNDSRRDADTRDRAKLGEGEGVEEAIIEANEDGSVDGIMVYYPIFGAQQVRWPWILFVLIS